MSVFSPRDYRSWSFTDRSFLFAAAVSVLWHLFWFFSVTIVVNPKAAPKKVNTAMVSLGPVLDDAIFKTLVESRPEQSKAFYRELSDFESATELPVQTVERHESGEVTSLPTGEKFVRSLREIIGGDKLSPPLGAPLGGLEPGGAPFELTGDVTADGLLSRPKSPPAPPAPVEIAFEVDSAGKVAEAHTTRSSGDEATDRRWEDHLRQWLFAPSPILGPEGRVKAKVLFRPETEG